MKPLLVGLSGLAGAGKSTAAMSLKVQHGFRVRRFAGPLKAMMSAMGLSHREIEGDLKEQPCELLGGKTPRYAMQTLGTEWGRNLIDGSIWLRLAEREIDLAQKAGENLVFDDCRFENEAELIRRWGGVVWRIEGRPPALFSQAQHASEQQDWLPDAYLRNDGSIADLQGKVYAAVTSLVMA